MDTAAAALLIVVSSTLTVFLIVGIIAIIKINKLLDGLQHITEQAEKFVDTAESAAELFKKSAGPVAITRFIANITQSVFNQDKNKDKSDE